MNKIHTFFKLWLGPVLNIFAAIFIALNLSGCQFGSTKPSVSTSLETPTTSVSKSEGEVSVMLFNVENLFDTTHDVGTEDYANLPLAHKNTPEIQKFCSEVKNPHYKDECYNKDWNEDVLKFKLSQLAKVIRHTDQGKGPDVLMLAEVENLKVLTRLAQIELKDLGYQTVVLIEGPDLRGIDPGFISKFPLVGKPQLHLIPYTDPNPEQLKYAKRSRGILEATVRLPNKKEVTFLIGHFPSQSNPTAWRKQAVEFATKKMIEYNQQGRSVIMGGDLNIIPEEEKDYGYFSKIFSTAGAVSHLVGCQKCEGSHNYKGEWSFLDVMIYGNKIDQAGLTLIPESITVLKVAHHMKRNGTPLDFREDKKEGVSDHYPLYSRLKIK
jgi:endonuclease/exonuclease/phosphatase family metal-dependent hydrolase